MTLPNADDELLKQVFKRIRKIDVYDDTEIDEEEALDAAKEIIVLFHKSNLQRAIDELENINNLDVPATYEQDGKTWQGLAIPRNLTKKRLAELQAELQQAEKEQ